METPTSTNSLKVTIHPDNETLLQVGGWPINTNPSMEREPERIDVEKDGRNYSLIFTTDGVKVEIWEVDENEELGGLLTTIDLPSC